MSSQSGRALLQLLKNTIKATGPTLSLPVGSPVEALLRPVATQLDAQKEDDVRCLTEWRNKHVASFMNEFVASIPRTRQWLATTVGPSDTRILFMVERLDGEVIGYMGLAYIDWERACGEADAIVRGRPSPKFLMTKALRTMLDWSTSQLGLEEIWVRVRSDNPALRFYENFGFKEIKRVPLQKRIVSDGIQWVEDAATIQNDALTLVHMRLAPRGGTSDGRR